jgi:hypothetical protein
MILTLCDTVSQHGISRVHRVYKPARNAAFFYQIITGRKHGNVGLCISCRFHPLFLSDFNLCYHPHTQAKPVFFYFEGEQGVCFFCKVFSEFQVLKYSVFDLIGHYQNA